MKQFFCLVVLLAICFASTSFELVRIKPKADTTVVHQYSAEETANANWVRRVKKENGLPNPDSIYPGNFLVVPLNDTGKVAYIVKKNDQLLKVAPRYRDNFGGYSNDFFPPADSSLKSKKKASLVFTHPSEIVDFNPWTWLFGVIAFIVLVALVFKTLELLKADEKIKSADNKNAELRNQNYLLKRELEEAKNQIPVKALEVVDETWLKNNSAIEPSSEEDIVLSDATINRVFGKKPDLIATALVSTKGKAVNMKFSHAREAITGLKDVRVHLGWNWNPETKDWEEVGMVASVCANGFEVNPGQIVKTDNLFTKIGIANKERRPVTFVANAVPDDAPYPSLLKTIMIEYHRDNIKDLEKSGLTIEDLSLKKPRKGPRK